MGLSYPYRVNRPLAESATKVALQFKQGEYLGVTSDEAIHLQIKVCSRTPKRSANQRIWRRLSLRLPLRISETTDCGPTPGRSLWFKPCSRIISRSTSAPLATGIGQCSLS